VGDGGVEAEMPGTNSLVRELGQDLLVARMGT
jgi:hypothetical protein